MPAAWQASGTLLGALTTADVTPVIPTHVPNDILLCVTANRVITNTCSTPSGWTLLGLIDTTAWRTYFFWRRALTAAETNPLCDWTATSADKYAQVHTIRGAREEGAPFVNNTQSADVTDPITATGSTSAEDNQLVIVAGIGSDDASASVVSVVGTDPAAYTQRHYSTIITGADAAGWFFDATRATAGATGTVTLDFVSTMPAAANLVAPVRDQLFPVALVTAWGRS